MNFTLLPGECGQSTEFLLELFLIVSRLAGIFPGSSRRVSSFLIGSWLHLQSLTFWTDHQIWSVKTKNGVGDRKSMCSWPLWCHCSQYRCNLSPHMGARNQPRRDFRREQPQAEAEAEEVGASAPLIPPSSVCTEGLG